MVLEPQGFTWTWTWTRECVERLISSWWVTSQLVVVNRLTEGLNQNTCCVTRLPFPVAPLHRLRRREVKVTDLDCYVTNGEGGLLRAVLGDLATHSCPVSLLGLSVSVSFTVTFHLDLRLLLHFYFFMLCDFCLSRSNPARATWLFCLGVKKLFRCWDGRYRF